MLTAKRAANNYYFLWFPGLCLVLPRFKDYSYGLVIPHVYYFWLKIKEMRGVTPSLTIAVAFMLPVADQDLLSLPGIEPGVLLTEYHNLLVVFVSWILYLYYLHRFYVFEDSHFSHSPEN